MLFSALALWWYRRQRYVAAGFAGAFASATRPLGIALAIGLTLGAFIDRLAWRNRLAVAISFLQGHVENIVPLVLVTASLLTIATQAKRLGVSATAYVALCMLTILFSGTPFSMDRELYAVIPVLCVFGVLFARFPPAGYVGLTASAILMIVYATRFAAFQWVG